MKLYECMVILQFVSVPQITEDFIAAYQANYGFTQDGTPDANSAAVSSTDPAAPAPAPDIKPPERGTPGDPQQTANSDESETAKEAKQKGEKRKAEQGTAAPISTTTVRARPCLHQTLASIITIRIRYVDNEVTCQHKTRYFIRYLLDE